MTATVEPRPGELAPLEWPDLAIERPADGGTLAAAGAAAVLTDLAVRSGVAGVAGALLPAVAAVALVATGRLPNRRAWPLAVAAPVFGAALAARTSPWLVPLDVLAAGGLLVLASSLAREGDPLDLNVPDLIERAGYVMAHGLFAPAFLAGALRVGGGRARSLAAVARGLLLAVPVVAVLAALLASADPVFASLLDLPDVDNLVVHGLLLVTGAWAMATLARLASARPSRRRELGWRPLGRVEATTVLAGLVALYAVFAASQAWALVGGARTVLRTAGLTYAEYARSGFFQLIAAAALTLIVLLAVRAGTDVRGAGNRRLMVLAEVAIALTLVIVVVAVRRLQLYEQAFGLTMLRLYSTLFAVWVGAVFVLLGLSFAGAGGRRAWLVPVSVSAGLVILLVLGAVNPEALVVRRNVERYERTGRLDASYLSDLSDDAVPALAGSLPRLDPTARSRVLATLCAGPRRATGGLWTFNASADAAIEARKRVCP